MKRIIGCLLALIFIVVASSGCAGAGESASERSHRWDMVANQDASGLTQDIDLLLQTDRPSRLTRWHAR